MAKLDKYIEEKIFKIFEKYQKENARLLNYLIAEDNITFFLPVANGIEMSENDLEKIAEILNASFEGKEIVNQEYRFKFKYQGKYGN